MPPPPDVAWPSPVRAPPWCHPLDTCGAAFPSAPGVGATPPQRANGEAERHAKGAPLPFGPRPR